MKNFLKLFWQHLDVDRVLDGAAILSFYFLFSLFPGLLVLFSLISYIPPEIINDNSVTWWLQYTPKSIANLINGILSEIGGKKSAGFLSIGTFLALWTAGSGMAAVLRQLNLIYEIKETRGFMKIRLVATLLTMGLGVLTLGPYLLYSLVESFSFLLTSNFKDISDLLFNLLRLKYVFLGTLMFVTFMLIYYFGLCEKRKIKFLVPGGIFGAIVLILLLAGFDVYLKTYGNYQATYGSISAVIILLLWLYIAGLVLLLGAEINAQFERFCTQES